MVVSVRSMAIAHRRLILALLAVTIALGAPLPRTLAADHEPTCMSVMSQDGGGMADPGCGCGDSPKSNCLYSCAYAFTGATLAFAAAARISANPSTDRVAALSARAFNSRTGPPGLRPPR